MLDARITRSAAGRRKRERVPPLSRVSGLARVRSLCSPWTGRPDLPLWVWFRMVSRGLDDKPAAWLNHDGDLPVIEGTLIWDPR